MKSYAFIGTSQCSAYFFGKYVGEKRGEGETHAQLEERVWRMKINTTSEGQCCIPGFALKNGLESAAKRIGMPVPGMGKSNFTRLFREGILCLTPLPLFSSAGAKITVPDVIRNPLFVPSDGKRGSGSRVERIFPTLHSWTFEAEMNVIDERITADILSRHLKELGKYIGFGAMRAENGGINGRFEVSDLTEVDR